MESREQESESEALRGNLVGREWVAVWWQQQQHVAAKW